MKAKFRLPGSMLLLATSLLFVNPSGLSAQCSCGQEEGELVANGNFSLPCTRTPLEYTTSTNMTFVACGSTGLGGPGNWTEAPDASLLGFVGIDHTTGTNNGGSNFLIFDAATNPPTTIWQQTVAVESGKRYLFSAFVTSIAGSNAPQFELHINGAVMPDPTATGGSTLNTWSQLCGRHTATFTGNITISVVVTSGQFPGNDGGLDDVSFRETHIDPRFSVQDNQCTGTQLNFVPNNTAGTHTWNFGDGSATSTLASPPHTYTVPGTYTVTHTIVNGNCGTASWTFRVTVRNCNECCTVCPNMVTNGDFSAPGCKTAYMSDFILDVPCPDGQTDAGFFTETRDASVIYPGAWCGRDHTNDNPDVSRFLIADAHQSNNLRAWIQPLNVTGGLTYCFRAWIKNVDYGPNSAYPSVALQIRAIGTTTVVARHNFLKYQGCCGTEGWIEICGTWTAPGSPVISVPIELSILVMAGNWQGNDIGIDDIEFGPACDHPQSPPGGGNNGGNDPVQYQRLQKIKNDVLMNDEGKVFPVPVHKGEILSLSLKSADNEEIKLEIMDISGKVVMKLNERLQPGRNTIRLQTGTLSPGTYTLRSHSGGGLKNYPIIIIE